MTFGLVSIEKVKSGRDFVTIINDTLITYPLPSTSSDLSTNLSRLPPAMGTRTSVGLMQKTIVISDNICLTCAGSVASIVKVAKDFIAVFGRAGRRSTPNFEDLGTYTNSVFKRLGLAQNSIEFIVTTVSPSGRATAYQYPKRKHVKVGGVSHFIIGSGSFDIKEFLDCLKTGNSSLVKASLGKGIPLVISSVKETSINFNPNDNHYAFSSSNAADKALVLAAQAMSIDTVRGALLNQSCNGIVEITCCDTGAFRKLDRFRIVLWLDDNERSEKCDNSFIILSQSRRDDNLLATISRVSSAEDNVAKITELGSYIIGPMYDTPENAKTVDSDYFSHSPERIVFSKINCDNGVLTSEKWLVAIHPGAEVDFLVTLDDAFVVDPNFLDLYRGERAKGHRYRTTDLIDISRLARAERMARGISFSSNGELVLGHNPPIDPLVIACLRDIPEPLNSDEKVDIFFAHAQSLDITAEFAQMEQMLRIDNPSDREAIRQIGIDLHERGGISAMQFFHREMHRQFGAIAGLLEHRWDGVGEWLA